MKLEPQCHHVHALSRRTRAARRLLQSRVMPDCAQHKLIRQLIGGSLLLVMIALYQRSLRSEA